MRIEGQPNGIVTLFLPGYLFNIARHRINYGDCVDKYLMKQDFDIALSMIAQKGGSIPPPPFVLEVAWLPKLDSDEAIAQGIKFVWEITNRNGNPQPPPGNY